uniref:Retinoic acid receptor responder protein 2 n=1 Tax=Equus asinus TaxID=9793 RepID=A0A9L0J2M6_EQUAS
MSRGDEARGRRSPKAWAPRPAGGGKGGPARVRVRVRRLDRGGQAGWWDGEGRRWRAAARRPVLTGWGGALAVPGAGGAQEVGVGGDGGRPARGRGGARAGDREEAERLAQSQPRGVSERPQGSGKEPFLAGTFVRLEFKLQQTSCQKKDWKKAECRVKPHGRKRKCLACIKLDSENKVLGRMVHCPIETQAQLELEQRQEAQCSKVEQAGEDPHSYYFPGQFAFSKALPPS